MSATRSSRKVYTCAFVVRAFVTALYCPARFCPARFCYCALLSVRFCRRGFVLRAFVGSPFKISTHHTNTQNFTGFLSNKESTKKPVFSHTKHLQINNLHIFTIVFHSRHILFLHDLLIHLFFPFHMSDHHLAKGFSLSSVHDSGIHSPLIPETHLLYQYSVPDSKHTSSKLRSLPRLFPISLDCLPGF